MMTAGTDTKWTQEFKRNIVEGLKPIRFLQNMVYGMTSSFQMYCLYNFWPCRDARLFSWPSARRKIHWEAIIQKVVKTFSGGIIPLQPKQAAGVWVLCAGYETFVTELLLEGQNIALADLRIVWMRGIVKHFVK